MMRDKRPTGRFSFAIYFINICYNSITHSSPQLCVRPVDNAFVHTDAGVPVDYELDSSSWYDLAKLDQFVSNIK